ncbi:hypothetical protein P879_05508 [Paragonimus westermani]|uniref:Lamin B n=1 Tax=Paragonimus westermani TaxID=34504 RepID=A0A8T0DQM5_9TREM|nr:hypothetical protein P879_05508 [Paragonimus westermani]
MLHKQAATSRAAFLPVLQRIGAGQWLESRRQRSRLSRRPIPEGQSTDASSEEGDHPGSDKTDGTSTALAMSRMKEKEELQHLNDRLARYIEFIQGNLLSPELTGDLDLMSESIKKKLNDLGRVYTDELDALRKNLDKVALQLTKNQVQLKTASSARDEALKELDEANTRESRLSKQLASLAAQLARVEKELSQSQRVQSDHDNLSNQHKILKQQLEQETLLRTELENRILTLTEQLAFKDKLLKKERDTFATETLHVHLKAVSQEAEKYRVKLKSKLDELRREMSGQLKDLMSRMEKNMETKLKAEKDRTRGAEAAAEAAREAHDQVQALLTTRSEELTRCRSELETTRQGVNELNASLRDMDTKHRDALERSQRELNRVLDLLEAKSNECADLAGIKVQLDAELAMYRSLLDSEESRCRLSPSERPLTGKSLVKKNVKKRPLSAIESDVDLDARSTKTEVGFAEGAEQRRQLFQRPLSDSAVRITCSSNGSIHFTSADPSDGLVRIFNASDETVNLGNWRLQFEPTKPGATDSTVLHVFPESQQLKPHSELQIHLCSSVGGQADQISSLQKRRRLPSPVLYVITDAQIWQPYDSAIKLKDSENVVRAICEIKPLASSSLGVGGLRRSNHGNSVVSSFRVTCTADGNMHFETVELGDGMLYLCNASNEAIDLSNWHIKFKTKNHEVSQSLAPNSPLDPLSKLRIYVLCSSIDRDSSIVPRDKSCVYILTDAPIEEHYNSTFTLYDSDENALAVSQWESIDKSKGTDSSLQLTNIDFGSVHFRHEVRSDLQGYSDAGALVDTAIVDRYRNFVVSSWPSQCLSCMSTFFTRFVQPLNHISVDVVVCLRLISSLILALSPKSISCVT